MSSKIDLLFSHIDYIFNKNWKSQKTTNKACFNNISIPFDEYVIERHFLGEITVSVPLNEVAYKKTFLHNDNINSIIDYLKMHVELYENRYKSNNV
jgi:hypothetical protein